MRNSKRTTKLVMRSHRAEQDRDELAAEVIAMRAELDRLKHDNRYLELAVTKLIHDKIALGQQLMQQRYLLDFLQGRTDVGYPLRVRAFQNN